jgi:hypothetical protein
MAKTIEELKEMIDSVIVENGKGQITGQGLNLVLNEMSDSLSEMGGGGVYLVHVPLSNVELTEEQIAFNAQQFVALESKLQNGEVVQVGAFESLKNQVFMMFFSGVLFTDIMGTGNNQILLALSGDIDSSATCFILLPDGSVIPAMN